MHLFASALPRLPQGESQLLFTVVSIAYVLVSFIRVATYASEQAREGRLIEAGHAPPNWSLPAQLSLLFALGVLLLLFFQSPFYMIAVVMGLSLCLLENRRSAAEQFGLARLPVNKVVKWSFLICGAVIFIEVPLSNLIDMVLTALGVNHPQQEAVEIFQSYSNASEIFGFVLQAVIISPLIEELFFRGFLLTVFKNRMRTWTAILLSAAIFAVAHANLGSVVQLWILGVVLGVAYEHTGSLLLPIGIHGCWNLLTAVTLLAARPS